MTETPTVLTFVATKVRAHGGPPVPPWPSFNDNDVIPEYTTMIMVSDDTRRIDRDVKVLQAVLCR